MPEVTSDTETGEILDGASPDEDLKPDDDLEEGEDPDAQPAPPADEPDTPPLSEKQIEQAFGKLEREAKRHRDRLGEIMGDDADELIPCELCDPNFGGFRFPGPVEPVQREAIALAIGLTGELGMIADPETRICPYCEGMGETITGSKVQGQTTRACPKCGAKGWMNDQEWQAYSSTLASREAMRDHSPERPPSAPDHDLLPQFDAWTRPRGHEFYGVNPVYMSPDQRARDWHGAQ